MVVLENDWEMNYLTWIVKDRDLVVEALLKRIMVEEEMLLDDEIQERDFQENDSLMPMDLYELDLECN